MYHNLFFLHVEQKAKTEKEEEGEDLVIIAFKVLLGIKLTYAFVRHHDVGVSFAHLLLLLAPVLDANWLVGFHHVCDLEIWVHLLEEEEQEEGANAESVCVKP